MPEFLETLENLRAEQASAERLYQGDGRRVRSRTSLPQYQAQLLETVKLLERVYRGDRRAAIDFSEAMGTSDFPYLFGDVLDRQLLAVYRETPAVYRSFCRISTVSDFRNVHRFQVTGGQAYLANVPVGTSYPQAALTDVQYAYAVAKYGRRINFAWEAIINDDLQALQDIPQRLGVAARRTESRFATALYCGATGPDTTLYSVAHKNVVNATNAGANFTAVNPALSIAGLQEAMAVLALQTDPDGEPIAIDAVVLVVPPALEVTALNIVNATQIVMAEQGGTANQTIWAQNWMSRRVSVVVDPYIPIIASSSGGATSWFLFASPAGNNAALEMGFLRGHESPEIFVKTPNAQRVGGGQDPLNGDFDTDSVEYKVRHVLGGSQLDYRLTAASTGAGS